MYCRLVYQDCLDDVASWMAVNQLQLSHCSKTEALWCSSTHRQHQIPTMPVRVGGTSVQPVAVVWNLGIYLDADVTMRSHVTATVCVCFATLWQISSIRHSLSHPALLSCWSSFVHSSFISKLDYCNTVLAAAPETLLQPLQSVLNVAAWLVFSARKTEHTAPRTTLAQRSSAYQVSAKRVDLPLSSRLSAELPCGDRSSSFQLRCVTPSLIYQHFNLVGSDNTSFNTGWLRVSGVCNKSLEFPASSCQGRALTAKRLPPRNQNWTVQAVLSCPQSDTVYCSTALQASAWTAVLQ